MQKASSLITALVLCALAISIVHAETISLASTINGESFISEDSATGSFGRVNLGDGTRPALPGDAGDGDAAYDINQINDPNPTQFGSDIDLFPRETDFLVGGIEFDETQVSGSGVETVQIDAINLAEFWSPDPNRVTIDPATVLTDFSDKGIGLYFFELPGSLTFGPLDASDTVTFTDGTLTSIDLSITAQFNVDTTNFGGAGLTAWDGTFSITGNQLSYQILDTENLGGFFGDSTFEIDITGVVNAVGIYSIPQTGTLALSADSFSVAEDGGSVAITVNRSGGSDGPASVAYATKSISATGGEDYSTTIGTLVWNDGEDGAKVFDIPITDDSTFEGDETFSVSLGGATGAALGTPASASVTIVENDENPAIVSIELAGPATGFVAINNFKNSSTQNGIEGNDMSGVFNPNHNGLPEYPNFQIPDGFTNGGVWSAIIASPQSSASDYASIFSSEFYADTALTVNNQTITQPDFDTLSAGEIAYDGSVVSSTGISTIPVSELSIDFNTFAWDGNITPAQTGDARSSFDASYASPKDPIMISPFSPVYTPYNDGSGSGNAQVFYQISLSNVAGNGLTFTDGLLTDMDIQGDVLIELFVAPFFGGPFGGAEFTGTFSASGLSYEFDVAGTAGLAIFSGINLIMNRRGGVAPPDSFAVSASVDGGNGSVSCDPAFVLAGGSSQCTAVPDAGFKVGQWMGDCAAAGTSSTCNLSNIQTDQTSTVSFTELQPGNLRFLGLNERIDEDQGPVVVAVERLGGSDGAISVNYNTMDGTATQPADYVASSGTLQWPDGDNDIRFIEVELVDDSEVEGLEFFEIQLTSPTGGASIDEPSVILIEVRDDDDDIFNDSFEPAVVE